MDSGISRQAGKHMSALETWMVPLFAKAPHLPESARQTLAKIAPWLALIFGILGLFGILSAGILSSMFAFSFVGMGMVQISMVISLLAGLISSVLEIFAFKPLSARRKKGWNYLFYATVLMAVSALIGAILGYSGALGNILGILIGFWLLFEVRRLYQ